MSFIQSVKNLFAQKKKIIGTTDLKRALTHNEFVFYYQPEWDLKTGKIKGVEALIRWESPSGIIPPNEFIPILEETGMINSFTPFLFSQTLNDLRELHTLGFSDLFMSVNLSAVQLRDPKLVETAQKNLEQYAILPEYLECEITENKFVGKEPIELETLKGLKKMGIRISIDDFGSGHASFNYIKNININKIKVDIEFIRDLFEKEANQTIMRTIIELGHSLNLSVLAEGVEKPEQEKWLCENGCDYAQGFLFSRPLPLPMLISFLRTHVAQTDQSPVNE
ncbi:MAG: EAL domain-containing protein [Alphaproteobacteria bacterium]|nr:EAL domain-containing protein [Alphaproteobacteria bacterium]